MKLIGISGSLRAASLNTGLLRIVEASLPDGVSWEVADFTPLPPYNFDVQEQGFPDEVEAYRALLLSADGIVIASPEYNYSIPGMLKNAIDWMSRGLPRPFDGMPTMIMGASNGNFGTSRMQNHLRTVLLSQNAMVLNKPEILVGQAKQKFDEKGNLHDTATIELIQKTTHIFISHVKAVQNAKSLA